MLALNSVVKIYIATSYVDFRAGIDSLAGLRRNSFKLDPMDGSVFIFVNRRRTSVKVLTYDGQGFWLATKRLSSGTFTHYPRTPLKSLLECVSEQAYVLFRGGDPGEVTGLPDWRPIKNTCASVNK